MKTQNRLDNEAKDCIRCKVKKREATNKICSSCRMKDWRRDNPDKIKAYLTRNKDRIREKRAIYYEENKCYFNKYNSDRRKRTRYAEDKSPERKRDMNIRSRTRAKYPLADNKCKCGKQAVCRHHTTEPMEVDKFDFMCRKCHDDLHVELSDASQEKGD